ncbi:MAG TPA: glycoside hydrolase family 15 protein, partial [Polyangiaceae bacterium]|nr:glycoside hydrolase family 15 protein [Polyangiaceae bacterium]
MTRYARAPGAPGVAPRWSTSRKSGVCTTRTATSNVWFALHQGIIGEVFYPRVDLAAVKDLQLLITDGHAFFSEERADTATQMTCLEEGVPAFSIVNTCRRGRYRVEKTIVSDPLRPSLLQRTRFCPLQGESRDYRVHVLVAPRLGNQGTGNDARIEEYKGQTLLLAESRGCALALACSVPWRRRSVGYAGHSDGWQMLRSDYWLSSEYDAAPDGNVALIGEIDLADGDEFVLALGFGRNQNEAAHRARMSLTLGFDVACQRYRQEWSDWQRTLLPLASPGSRKTATYRASTAVLATHESKGFPGGIIASLSFPWGESRGDQSAAGYHLIWPRDACEAAGALLAAGAQEDMIRVLRFFEAAREADGHWPQNMWLDGTGHWTGIQLDETAAPILLVDLARRYGALSAEEVQGFWPMLRGAAAFLVRMGPATPQDRWEEDAGITPYTLAHCIAALLVAADLAEQNAEPELAKYLRETADYQNDSIERWLYVSDTELARQAGVPGYFVHVAPRHQLEEAIPLSQQRVRVANLPPGSNEFPASEIVSPDAIAFVRLGLRAPDDPRIIDTLRVVDRQLKVETPNGPCWRRYSHDGYGEHADGSAFDGRGIGRPWPLLVAERAHHELAAGRTDRARQLLEALERFASELGPLSEQIWDG